MADPKGVYYGPQETGLATILPRESQGDFLDYVSADRAAKLKYAQDQAKAKQEAIKNFKPEDVGRFHREAVNQFLQETIEGYANGNIDDYEAQKRLVEYSTYAANSMNIEKDWDAAMKVYEKDDRVNAANAQSMLQGKYLGDGGIESAKTLSTEPLNPNFFLEEKGGSAAINEDKAVQQVISNNFDDLTEKAYLSDEGSWKRVGLGVKVRDEIARREKLTAIAKVGPNDSVVVKTGEELVDDGVVEAFMADPYMRRVLMDKVGKDNPTPTELGNVLSEILKPRVKGTVEEIRKTNYVKENYDSGAEFRDTADGDVRKIKAILGGKGYEGFGFGETAGVGGMPEMYDSFLEGLENESGRYGKVVYKNGKPFVEFTSKEELAKEGKGDGYTAVSRTLPFTPYLIMQAYGQSRGKEVMKQLRQEGLIDQYGNFKELGTLDGEVGQVRPGKGALD